MMEEPSTTEPAGLLELDEEFLAFCEQYYELVENRARSLLLQFRIDHDPADVAQDVFRKATWAYLQGQLVELHPRWLMRVTSNTVISLWRYLKVRPQLEPIGDLEPQAPVEHEFEETSLGYQEERAIIAMFMVTNPRYQRILERKYIDGWSLKRIAAEEGSTTSAARSVLQRAVKEVRANFDDPESIPIDLRDTTYDDGPMCGRRRTDD